MKNLFFALFIPALFGCLCTPLLAQDYNIALRSTLDIPGQTLANICGYAQNGREYALLGASKGLIIVDVTDPEHPVNLQQIPGPNNLWKEIKVFQHYAYVTSEGGQGVQIVDLSSLPTPTTVYHSYKGDGAISGTLNTIHALHIDVKKGFLYLYGSNLFGGGAVICDLNQDPYNPVYAGKYDSNGYIHDGYVDNDTLFAAHINAGFLSVVNMADKQNPEVFSTIQTPGKFTHNAWILDDHKTILTTDEEYPSFVTSYDITDPSDLVELDRSSTDDGNNAIAHNTHVRENYAINSYYIDGVNIVDAHRPDNLVEVGRYDTWASSGKFDGCWGVYPFLPSGNLIASNIPNTGGGTGRLFVLTPTYLRGCYIEGQILNGCNGQPLFDAEVRIVGAPNNTTVHSKPNGVVKTGVGTPGIYTVTVSKPGYLTQTFSFDFQRAVVIPLNVTLLVDQAVTVPGKVKNALNQAPLANTTFHLQGNGQTFEVQSDAQGAFQLLCITPGKYKIGAWGFLNDSIDVSANTPIDLQLTPGYYDDFELDLGWTHDATAISGFWEWCVPIGTFSGNQTINPDTDAPEDNNSNCYVTGNGGGNAGSNDVDNGEVVLTTPNIKLGGFQTAVLSFDYWFVNSGGQGTPPNDNFTVKASNGQQSVTVFSTNQSNSAWLHSGDILLNNFITLNNSVKIQFIAADVNPGHLVEAGVDVFKVSGFSTSAPTVINSEFSLMAAPNPSAHNFLIQFYAAQAGLTLLEVRNLLGQPVWQQQVSESGSVQCGENWPKGIYFMTLRNERGQSQVLKLEKL